MTSQHSCPFHISTNRASPTMPCHGQTPPSRADSPKNMISNQLPLLPQHRRYLVPRILSISQHPRTAQPHHWEHPELQFRPLPVRAVTPRSRLALASVPISPSTLATAAPPEREAKNVSTASMDSVVVGDPAVLKMLLYFVMLSPRP